MLTQVVWGDNLLQHKIKWSPRTTCGGGGGGGGTVSCMTGLHTGN